MGQEESRRDSLAVRRERPPRAGAGLTRHLVAAERLEVRAGRGLDPGALLDRISALNRGRFLAVIERVLDEFDRPGEVIRLDRIELDLGRFDADRLGQAEARLEAALRSALRAAVRGEVVQAEARPAAVVVAESVALLEAFEHFLVHGSWPYRSGVDPAASPARCLLALLESEPMALVAMLRRRGPSGPLLRRLVLQMDEAGLQGLLRRLEPAHAAHVIACLDEIRESHGEEPVVPVPPPELDHMLWTIVLRDALSRAGLQANRKAFLRRLLSELALSSGVALAALVAQLRRGAAALRAFQNEGPSVIELLSEIAAEDESLVGAPLLIIELARLLGGRDSSREETRAGVASLVARAFRSRRGELRWLLARLVREDARALSRRLPRLVPVTEAVALLSGDTSQAAYDTVALADTRDQIAILLTLAAGGGPTPWSPAAAAEALGLSGEAGTSFARTGARPSSPKAGRGSGGEAMAWTRPRNGAPSPVLAPSFAGSNAIRERLAGLIGDDSSGVGGRELLAEIDAAAHHAPHATRALLRSFAAADPARLIGRFAGVPPRELIARMLPHSLSGPLVAWAEQTGVREREYTALIEAAANAAETTIPAWLVAQAAETMGRRASTASRALAGARFGATARLSLALAELGLVWRDDVPLDLSQRAASVSRLLPDLASAPPAVLRARLDAAGGAVAARRLLQAMSGADLYRLAAALAPAGRRQEIRRRLREASAADRAEMIRHLVVDGTLPQAPAKPATAEALAPALRESLARLAASLSRRGLDALLRAFGPPAVKRGVRSDPATMLVARIEQAVIALGLDTGPGWTLRRLLVAIARAGGGRGASFETALSALPLEDARRLHRAIDPALGEPAGAAALPRRFDHEGRARADFVALLLGRSRGVEGNEGSPPSPRRWAALLRARPLVALEWMARSERRRGWAGELEALVRDPAAATAAFARLPEAERARSLALGRLLTGSRGRRILSAEKMARALARAVSEGAWRSGAAGFADRWIALLLEEATLAERVALRTLLDEPSIARRRRAAAVAVPVPEPKRLASPASGRKPTVQIGKAAPGRAASRGEASAAEGPLVERVLWLLGRTGGSARSEARRLVANEGARRLLAGALGEEQMLRLLALLAGAAAPALMRVAEQVAAARQLAGHGLDRATLWRALLASAAASPGDVAPLLRRLLGGSDGVGFLSPAARGRMEAILRSMLDPDADAPLLAALGPAKEDERRVGRKPEREASLEPGESIKVENSGLVLASAFLPRLFETLDFVAPDSSGVPAWRDGEGQARSVHLLQWLVDERVDAPEPLLALNKLLCGLDPAFPVPAAIEPTERELATCRGLLGAILGNWPPLASSSVAALRESFLQREGRLTRLDAGWKLEVERQVIDILLDQLPWGFSTILHPWMEGAISVQWR